jgi:hypothetical protein
MSNRDVTAGSRRTLVIAFLALLAGVPAALSAQPFGLWTAFAGDGKLDSTNGVLTIPDSPPLNPTSALTIEAWISVQVPAVNQSCRSIIGKGYQTSYWVGVCNSGPGGVLRSYTHGTATGSQQNAGVIPSNTWVHIAVTSDGTTRNHYVDGELVGTFAETAPPAASSATLQIGGDANWAYSPNGLVNEVRLWNVARTQDEIRSTINVPLRSAQPGLVAVWPMFVATDALGAHNGAFSGNIPPILGPPAIISCGASTAAELCLQSKFAINATWRTGLPGSGTTGNAAVAVASPGSGIFWFFDPSNWEVMVKVINGCALNNRWWVFSAATTNVYYQMNVTDVQSGQSKIYFNYPGPPAPAVTDTDAFPCP